MRYALRNQKKIAQAYDPIELKKILDSLNEFFRYKTDLNSDIGFVPGDQYDNIRVPDIRTKDRIIVLYVLGFKYDVCRLAFKEFKYENN